MQYRARGYLGFFCLAATAVASAQDCTLPGPFQHQFKNDATALLSAANAGDPCAWSVALNAGAGLTAAAFLHYRRPSPATSVRYGFRIDTSALANFGATNAGHVVLLFSASSPIVAGDLGPESHLLRITLAGGNPNPHLVLNTPRGGKTTERQQFLLTQTLNTLRVEINVGAGSAGSVRYWFNTSFSDPPTGTLDDGGIGLDNAAWIGVIAAEVGVSSASNLFRTNYPGSAIVFDQIESSDDLLFWDDFTFGVQ